MSAEKGREALLFREFLRAARLAKSLTQQELAENLDVDMKTISRWEQGKGLPRLKYRNKLCNFFQKTPQQMGFEPLSAPATSLTAGVLLEDRQLFREEKNVGEQKSQNGLPRAAIPAGEWSEIPYQAEMYGRTKELTTLRAWIEDEHCQVITISGMGGVGKTSLAARLAMQLKGKFEYIIWRSVQNGPHLQYILRRCVQYFSGHQQVDLVEDIDNQLLQLLYYLRQHRCLLVLDNFEAVLQAGKQTGRYREGYEEYGQLIRCLGEAPHQSCLVITSREKPEEIGHLEGKTAPVYTMYLNGLETEDGCKILEDKGLHGPQAELASLVELYSGNPLALKLVTETVHEVCSGDIARFLQQKEAIFVDLNGLLEEQYQRMSMQEQEIVYWLAIEREAVTLDTLRENLIQPLAQQRLLASLKFLLRRSMVESREGGRFTLQPAIMEYVTTRLLELFIHAFDTESPDVWHNYAMIKSQAKDYVRESQTHSLLACVAERLLMLLGKEGVEQQAVRHLNVERQKHGRKRGYMAGNILNLLIYLQSNLRGYDFSRLMIQQAYLQNAFLPEVNFAYSSFSASVFTSTLGNILSVAFSPDDTLLAIGTVEGEVALYDVASGHHALSYLGHTDAVWSVAFSGDGKMLASGSDDWAIRLWNASTGYCLNILSGHRGRVRSIAFHPAGQWLASGSEDGTARIWDISTGAYLKILAGHTERIWSLAFSPRGDFLATGSTDQTIRVWDVQTGACLQTLRGHTGWVIALAFDPLERFLASGGDDCAVHLWEIGTWECVKLLSGHSKRIRSLAFSQDGSMFVSGSEDRTLRLWNVATGQTTAILQGHTHGIRSVAFNGNGTLLASGGDDQTVRLWEVQTGYSLRTLQGYTNRVWSAALSVDGQVLASCSEDQSIRIWDLMTMQCRVSIYEPAHGVYCIAASPDGHSVVSGGEDMTVRIWEVSSGHCLKTLRGHTGWIRAVAVSLDGYTIASGSEDHSIRLWSASGGQCVSILKDHVDWVRCISFSPDGKLLASGSDDRTIRLWDVASGECVALLQGHSGHVRALAFSPDGETLISGGEDQMICIWSVRDRVVRTQLNAQVGWVRAVAIHPAGRIFAVSGDDTSVCLWDMQHGILLHVLRGHSHRVRWVGFSQDGMQLVSSSDDGSVKLWNLETVVCEKTFTSERPYEGMDITQVEGLTEVQKSTLRLLGAIEQPLHVSPVSPYRAASPQSSS